jgi:hypothetical protein
VSRGNVVREQLIGQLKSETFKIPCIYSKILADAQKPSKSTKVPVGIWLAIPGIYCRL